MPLLAALFSGLMTSVFTLMASLVGAQIAARLLAVGAVATLYVASVVTFSQVIAPWISNVFSSQYGQLLGLLFPPVAGTVLASLIGYWGAVAAYKYVSSLTRMAVG